MGLWDVQHLSSALTHFWYLHLPRERWPFPHTCSFWWEVPECEEPTALWANTVGKNVIDFWFMIWIHVSIKLGTFRRIFWHFSTSFNWTSKSELFHICPSHVPLCFVCFGRSITWASLMDGHNGIGISGSNGIVFGRFFRSLDLWRSQEGWPALSKGSNIWCLLYQRLTVRILFSLDRHLFCRKATN